MSDLRPSGLRLGTKLVLVGGALLLLLWVAATEAWRRGAERDLAGEPAERAEDLRDAVRAGVEADLRMEPSGLRQAVNEARAADAARLADERLRRLTEAPDLRRVVRERIEAAGVETAWIREADGSFSWQRSGGGGPLSPGPPPLDGECRAVAPGLPVTWARCLEVEVATGPLDRFHAGALRPVSAARGGMPDAGRWALYLAGNPPERIEASRDWPPVVISHDFTDSTGPADVRSRVVEVKGESLLVEAARLAGAPLVVAVAVEPARRLGWADLLAGSVGSKAAEWWQWLLLSGGSVGATLLFLAAWGMRLNRAFRPLVAAAQAVGRGASTGRGPVTRRDELGTLARVLEQADADLRAARAAYEREARVAAWRDVARGIAHEIKNPLMPIRGTVENLLRWRREDPARFDQHLESRLTTILEEVETLGRLASSFAEFARVPSPERVPSDLAALARDVVHLHAAAAPRVVVEDRLRDDLPPVPLDPKLVRQVVTNLVKNAVEAMGEAGGVLRLENGTDGRGAWLSVTDTGSGADDATLAALFAPYFSTKGPAGTGLGLFLSHRICVEHGGTLEADRPEGGGLRLTIRLPPA